MRVGEAVQKDFVQPEFHHAGDAVPGKGELPDDNIGFKQGGLFGGNVEAVIGIEGIEATDFRLWQCLFESFNDGFIGDGLLQIGMAGDNQDVFHGDSFWFAIYLPANSGRLAAMRFGANSRISYCALSG